MALKRERHSHGLEMGAAKKDLERQRSLFEEDKKRLVDRLKEEHGSETDKLKRESELKLMELQTLSKLDSDQRIAQAELDAKSRVQAAETKHAAEMSVLKSTLAKEYYDSLQVALKDMTINGTEQTKFVQELAIKMLDKSLEKPMPAVYHQISETRSSVQQ